MDLDFDETDAFNFTPLGGEDISSDEEVEESYHATNSRADSPNIKLTTNVTPVITNAGIISL
jgi:hypothetical protein